MNFKTKLAILTLTLLTISLFYLAVSLSLERFSISNTAKIKTIGVWCDTDFIDWGIVDTNESYTHIVRVNNTSNVPITLTIQSQNWKPTNISDYMTLTSTFQDVILQTEESALIDLTLNVASNVLESNVRDFSFDIIIRCASP